MKKNLFVTAIAVMAYFTTVNAQNSQKIGYVNSAEILQLMPESKTADGELQKFGQSLEAQLKTMGAEYQAKVEEYQSKKELMAEAIKQTKEKEIVDLQNRIQEFQQTAQESIQKKKEELYSPILKKAEEAIKTTAKDNGFSYVLDSSMGVLLYSESTNDIGALVKKKLGLPETIAPAASPAASPVMKGGAKK